MPISEARILQPVWARIRDVLRPPPPLTISEWADANRVLGPSSPLPGQWRTDVAPFLREIQDCLGPDSGVEKLVVVKPVQSGGTEALLNAAGYYLHHAPSTVMVVQPNQDMTKRLSRQRIEPLIDLCAPLRGLIAKARSKGGNEVNLKTFRNGSVLVLASAQSAASLRSLPARIVLADEVDAYLQDLGEGNPYDLAAARTTTFGTLRRVAAISTPTEAGISLIDALFRETDQRRWFMPCPHCGYSQVLTWENMRWEPKQPETARYACAACNADIEPHQKAAMLQAGSWKPTASGPPNVRGYHFSALISPWIGWGELVTQWEAAQDSIERKKTFTNLVLAEPWQEASQEIPEAAALAARCEPFAAEAPAGVSLITAGCDLQHDRLEVEIVGWGRGFESWSLRYDTIYGDPTQPHLWRALDELLGREFRHQSGMPLRISAACVDAGYLPDEVLAFTKERFMRRIYATKSLSAGFTKPVWPRRPIYNRKQLPLFLISADEGKAWFHPRLKVHEPGPGYCHFPVGRALDYFHMLTAEKLITRYRNGRPYREWINVRRERNEALDTRVYSIAALHALMMQGLNLDSHCQQFEDMLKPAPVSPIGDKPKPNGAPQTIRSRFVWGDSA